VLSPADRAAGRRPDAGTDPGAAATDLGAARASAAALVERIGDRPEVAVVLGTGMAAAADELGAIRAELPLHEVGGVGTFGAPGHRPVARLVAVGDRRVLVLLGRAHLYEGRRPGEVVHAVRTAVLAGCRTVVLTNAAGALRGDLSVGDLVLISDHLDLTGGPSCLVGLPPASDPSPFVDLTDAWSPRLRAAAVAAAPGIPSGVYAQLRGPQFETPAEIRMLAALGADLVGMSTVVEAVAARHLGAELLGISVVTNAAAGLAAEVSAASVAEVAAAAVPAVAGVLRGVLSSDHVAGGAL